MCSQCLHFTFTGFEEFSLLIAFKHTCCFNQDWDNFILWYEWMDGIMCKILALLFIPPIKGIKMSLVLNFCFVHISYSIHWSLNSSVAPTKLNRCIEADIWTLFLQPCSYQFSCMWVTRYLYTYLVLHNRVTMTHNRNISPTEWYLIRVRGSALVKDFWSPITQAWSPSSTYHQVPPNQRSTRSALG